MSDKWIDSEEHGDLVKWVIGAYDGLSTQLSEIFREMVDCAAVYHGRKKDPRKEHEMWRSNLHSPYGFSGIETSVAAEVDILLSPDPWIQADGVGAEDQKTAKAISRLLQHTLQVNSWPSLLPQVLRGKRMLGTSIMKINWEPRYTKVWLDVDEQERQRWRYSVAQAAMATGMQPPDPSGQDGSELFPGEAPVTFDMWRDMVAKAGFPVGPIPKSGWKEILRFKAPSIRLVDPFSIRLDPRIQDAQEQDVVIERIVRTKRWVVDRASDDPGSPLPFSLEAVERSLNGNADFDRWEADIARMLRVPSYRSALYSPSAPEEAPVELLEVWRRGADKPYMVVMNRTAVINRRPDELPHQHGMVPYAPVRNNLQPGAFFGISDLTPARPVYSQIDRIMNLLVDNLALSTVPITLLGRQAGLGKGVEQNFRPGAMWEVGIPDLVKTLKIESAPAGQVFQLIEHLQVISDDTMSTPRQVRGAMSQIGRVSATESERRFSQGLARQKLNALTTEAELRPMIHQLLALWSAHGSSDDRVNIGGRDLGLDALLVIPKESLIKALDQDFRFRGASTAVNRNERIGFISNFLMTGTRIQALAPQEIRALLAKLWQEGGISGDIITEDANAFAAMKAQREAQNAAAMSAVATDPGTGTFDDAGAYDASNAEPVGAGEDPAASLGSSVTPFV